MPYSLDRYVGGVVQGLSDMCHIRWTATLGVCSEASKRGMYESCPPVRRQIWPSETRSEYTRVHATRSTDTCSKKVLQKKIAFFRDKMAFSLLRSAFIGDKLALCMQESASIKNKMAF